MFVVWLFTIEEHRKEAYECLGLGLVIRIITDQFH
jgi:hypothetical protein